MLIYLLRAGRVGARLARQVEVGLSQVDLSLSQYRTLMFLDEGCGRGIGPGRPPGRDPAQCDRGGRRPGRPRPGRAQARRRATGAGSSIASPTMAAGCSARPIARSRRGSVRSPATCQTKRRRRKPSPAWTCGEPVSTPSGRPRPPRKGRNEPGHPDCGRPPGAGRDRVGVARGSPIAVEPLYEPPHATIDPDSQQVLDSPGLTGGDVPQVPLHHRPGRRRSSAWSCRCKSPRS